MISKFKKIDEITLLKQDKKACNIVLDYIEKCESVKDKLIKLNIRYKDIDSLDEISKEEYRSRVSFMELKSVILKDKFPIIQIVLTYETIDLSLNLGVKYFSQFEENALIGKSLKYRALDWTFTESNIPNAFTYGLGCINTKFSEDEFYNIKDWNLINLYINIGLDRNQIPEKIQNIINEVVILLDEKSITRTGRYFSKDKISFENMMSVYNKLNKIKELTLKARIEFNVNALAIPYVGNEEGTSFKTMTLSTECCDACEDIDIFLDDILLNK